MDDKYLKIMIYLFFNPKKYQDKRVLVNKQSSIIFLLIFLINGSFLTISFGSSVPYVEDLCYVRNQSTQIKVSTAFNPNYLSFEDKLNFNLPSSTVKVIKSLNEFDYTRSIEYLEHKNLVTGYVDLPYLVKSNSNGTTSYYTMDNKSYSGGWVGSVLIKNPKSIIDGSVYTEDRGRNIGTKYVPREKSDRRWETKFESQKAQGLIGQYTWSLPTKNVIQQYISQGYHVNVMSSKLISISNVTTTLTWDIATKTFIAEINNELGELMTRVIRTYVFNAVFNVDIIENFTTEEYNVFDSGDCYKEITQTQYSQFGDSCNSNVSFRDDSNSSQELLELELYPNPASDYVQVKLPKVLNGQIQIISQSGEQLISRRFNESDSISLNVDRYPSGMYIVRVITNDGQNYQSKFIKQ